MERYERRSVTRERLMKVLRKSYNSAEARQILDHPLHGLCNNASEQKPRDYYFNLMHSIQTFTAAVLEARRQLYDEEPNVNVNDNNNNLVNEDIEN